jgi:cytochrome c peroxidase
MKLFEGKAGCIRCHNGPLLTDHQFHYTGVPEISGGTPDGTKHKTQSLRDVNRRSSYMHNGHYLKLRHVIEHYARGGSAPAGLETEIKPLELSEEDKTDLMAFLLALNGRITTTISDSAGGGEILSPPPAKEVGGPAQDPAYLKRPR